jgi:hypothetical protein
MVDREKPGNECNCKRADEKMEEEERMGIRHATVGG